MNTTTKRPLSQPSVAARAWAVLWGLSSVATLWPQTPGMWPKKPVRWIRHTIDPDGGFLTEFLPAPHPTLWTWIMGIVLLCAATAPLVALTRRFVALAVLMAVLSIVTASVQDATLAVTLGAYLSLLGVACSALFADRRLGWALGGVGLLIPAAFALTGTVTMWSTGAGGGVQTSSSDFPLRLSYVGAYTLASVLALGTTTAIWLASRRNADRREVMVRSTEVDARAELARDLHDVVAHRMSLVAVRAETAPYSLDGISPQTREVFADIAAEARGALDEMRTVLGVLDRGGRATSAGTPVPPLAPQPGTGDIPTLVAAARDAGSPVELIGAVPPLDALTGTTAYRVVQETLTNARRHAPNQRADVAFTQRDGAVTLRVSNLASDEPFEEGRGIAGMRERVERSGGMFHVKHESDAAGTLFVVEATLPTRPSHAASTGGPDSDSPR